ncbi:MAG: hypothetical protein AABN34_08795 [Acidobacteriota bacterium]
MNLVTWHDELHTHFQELSQERVTEGGLVFVLEHGLAPKEVVQLEDDIRTYIQNYPPTDKHWLPWIVYAAELGYNYVGQEYWQTFEARTVGWHERGRERHWVRDKFRQFERDYGGAVPSGPWAQHFTIICHPITHAILPRDFQSQLTEVLYTIRHLFTLQNLQSSELLGELIRSHSLQQSNRFQQFVQDVQIVGLIAKALLNQEESHTGTILLPSTLQRIVTDLGREGVALDQLSDARRSAQYTQRRGLSSGSSSKTTFYGARTLAHDSVVIEPRLVLRRTAATSWETVLEVPDFTPLLEKRPTWRRSLEQSRAKVSGSRTMLARGRLLYGTDAEVQLRAFPEAGKPLLMLESDDTPDDLKRFLEENFSLTAEATILCRIASDGRAYQSRGLRVRPGRSYLALSTAGQVRSSQFTLTVNTACEGLYAAQLSVPETITPDCRILIERLGLTIAKHISVFPVGVAAAKWDNEGHGEWLVSDEPCVGIHIDHEVEALLLELDDEEESSLEVRPEPGQTVFVQMPPLSRGHHELCVSARVSANDENEEVGQLQITIREPRSWKLAINEQGALITIVEPRKPTIEQLMRGVASIEMHGPSGHQVQVTATFFGKHPTVRIEPRHKLPNLPLPIKFTSGRAYLAQLSRKPELQSPFDFADSCRIDFNAGELGTFSFTCEREFTPLRWVLEKNNTSYLLSLSDDSGARERACVTRYDFSRPDRPISVPYEQSFEDHVVQPSGGLYVARGSVAQCSIIFPHELEGSVRTFADMNRTVVEPQFQSRQPSIECLLDEIALFTLWTESRTTGTMVASLAQRRVLLDYIAHIFSILGGSKWSASERSYRSNPYHQNAAVLLSQAVVDVPSIGMSLLHQYETMKHATPKDHAAQLAETLKPFLKSIGSTNKKSAAQTVVRVLKGGPQQAEFALRLASAPETIEYWARNWFLAGLRGLIDNSRLACSARFIVLTTSYYLQNTESNKHTSLYAGWDWT